jgi:hypothetical protein
LTAEREPETPPPVEDEVETVTHCARHPNVETSLLCGRCSTPICPRCLVQTPVGARCPTCANVRRLPTVDVKPIFLARGLAAAVATGLAVGAFWGFATSGRGGGFVGFFIIFVALGIGWALGEAVSVATNRKRSVALQACAVFGVVVAYIVHNIVAGNALLPAGDFWGYVATVLAAFFAAQRLQR